MNSYSGAGPERIDTDLCIVGAGPAGITIARELAGSGIRVCLLESGGPDVRRGLQRQSRGESDGYPIHRLDESRVRAFGGTLRHPRLRHDRWAVRPLDPIDFEARPGVPDSGWPFGHEHLRPYYERALAVCGVTAVDPTSAGWPHIQGRDVETTLFQLTKVDFQDARATLSASQNVRVLLRCRVVEVAAGRSGRRVETVTAVRADGSRLVVRPGAVVFAAGGIENARLLLTADGGRGLGNEHDLVGRYFSERLTLPVGHVELSGAHSAEDAAFFDRWDEMCGALRVVDEVQRSKDLLNCAFSLVPRHAAVTTPGFRSLSTLHKAMIRRPLVDGLGTHVRNVVTGLGEVGGLAVDQLRTGRRALVVRAQGEQAPNRESRVTLGSGRDDLGMPLARVTWRVTDADRESIRTSLDIVHAALRAGGFGSVTCTLDDEPPTLVEGAHHHMGTTRMHVDPHKGVVDADCGVHSVANLYLAGSSVFPTYGLSNPTLTIIALAIRLGDHLREALA